MAVEVIITIARWWWRRWRLTDSTIRLAVGAAFRTFATTVAATNYASTAVSWTGVAGFRSVADSIPTKTVSAVGRTVATILGSY